MPAMRLLPLVLISVCVACNSRPAGDGAVACGTLEPRSSDEVALCNALDQAVIANVALPSGTPPATGWPAIVVLHGSGGLHQAQGEGDELGPCSMVLHDQFRIWRDILNERGYAVIMPDSFYSRGFCEWREPFDEVPRELDERERLIVRTFDARAAIDWLCEHDEIDCDRVALLGFSNGASVVLTTTHDDPSTLSDARLATLAPVQPLRGGVAYYPGCGLSSQLADTLDGSALARFLSPAAPLLVQHAALDPLLDTCAELRDAQVDAVAAARGRSEDWFELNVYANAEHGFDVWFTGDPQANLDARTAAQASTLDALAGWMQ